MSPTSRRGVRPLSSASGATQLRRNGLIQVQDPISGKGKLQNQKAPLNIIIQTPITTCRSMLIPICGRWGPAASSIDHSDPCIEHRSFVDRIYLPLVSSPSPFSSSSSSPDSSVQWNLNLFRKDRCPKEFDRFISYADSKLRSRSFSIARPRVLEVVVRNRGRGSLESRVHLWEILSPWSSTFTHS